MRKFLVAITMVFIGVGFASSQEKKWKWNLK